MRTTQNSKTLPAHCGEAEKRGRATRSASVFFLDLFGWTAGLSGHLGLDQTIVAILAAIQHVDGPGLGVKEHVKVMP